MVCAEYFFASDATGGGDFHAYEPFSVIGAQSAPYADRIVVGSPVDTLRILKLTMDDTVLHVLKIVWRHIKESQ